MSPIYIALLLLCGDQKRQNPSRMKYWETRFFTSAPIIEPRMRQLRGIKLDHALFDLPGASLPPKETVFRERRWTGHAQALR
jgi:hypothetical protein